MGTGPCQVPYDTIKVRYSIATAVQPWIISRATTVVNAGSFDACAVRRRWRWRQRWHRALVFHSNRQPVEPALDISVQAAALSAPSETAASRPKPASRRRPSAKLRTTRGERQQGMLASCTSKTMSGRQMHTPPPVPLSSTALRLHWPRPPSEAALAILDETAWSLPRSSSHLYPARVRSRGRPEANGCGGRSR